MSGVSAALLARLDTLSSHARQFLLTERTAADQPIRAELFGLHRFEEHGRSLAQAQIVHDEDDDGIPSPGRSLFKTPSRDSFFPRVEENLTALRQAYDYVALTSRTGHYVTPAAEWLLDNFHLVEAQLQQIREGLPRRYYASLPKLATAPLQGLPRVYGIAWAYVAHTDSVLNPEVFTAFLTAYQQESELRLSELWALPTTLRVVLLENLRRMADTVAQSKVAREVAHAVWDCAGQLSHADLDALGALMQQRDLQRSYLTQLWQRAPAEQVEAHDLLRTWAERHCPDGPTLMLEVQNSQVAANLTVGNIITTLRLIGQVDWVELIEPVSLSLAEFRRLPSFATESESTRRQITQSMERLARDVPMSERDVARAVVARAEAVPQTLSPDAAERTAGFYLWGPGRAQLEASLGLPSTTHHRDGAGNRLRAAWKTSLLSRRWTAWRLPIYLFAIALVTAAVVLYAAQRAAGLSWPTVVALLLLAWPASEVAAALVNRLIAESLKVRELPRLAFLQGIPPEHRVLVVIPTLLTSPAATQELARNLERHWLANREDNAQFALLTDWVDAPQTRQPQDAALLRDAIAHIAALNAQYPRTQPDAVPRFLLLHRPRLWSDTQQRWLGWERKRGKLEQLIAALSTGVLDGFEPLAPNLQLAQGIRYIVTLDSDTGMPPGTLRDLVAVAAHPLNAPQLDADARRVVTGYGILQPRVVAPLPAPQEQTPYHWLFGGQCGMDPYQQGISEVYHDLFGDGSFSGKGLLHVAALQAVLHGRLPSDAVLSHDLLEGSIARCGFVSDVVLVEGNPHHAGVAASRTHRWTRGDWQLLPLMLRAGHFGIDALGLWKMLDNLRRALVVPATFALLVWVSFTAALPLGTALLVTLAALLAGPLLGALAGMIPTRRDLAWWHFFHVGGADLLRAFGIALWQFTQLGAHAVMLLDAAIRTLWRLVVSRRLLLEWTTAAQAQASARDALAPFVRQHLPATLICTALAVAALWSPYGVGAAALFALWAASPVVASWASRPLQPTSAQALPDAEKAYLRTVARDTWRFFEQAVGPEDNHLPPDNLQLVPEPTLAHRTSPTNMGLYLLSVCCAREFGWISTGEVIVRLQASLKTMESLERHHGHLYNWYDTRTLAVLKPAYVSAVDSGNLAGLLLTVAQACLRLAREGGDGQLAQTALLQLAQRCHTLYSGMDFSGLYDARRHLFHIGLRVEEQALDASYYDLMASESRLMSFLAIAKGDVPLRHWAALGRSFLSVGIVPGLKSWSGSMFEYLMPSLLMHEPEDGLLHTAALAAIKGQQAYGAVQNLPWGISESGYFAQDHSLAFQYSPFGVPRLALRRTPATDRVIAPYATLLAIPFAPGASVANLRALEQLGARGALGFFEAVDFTVSHQPDYQPFSVVQSFMAHHQGMSLVALCNLLCDNAPRRWFSAEPSVCAYEALLHESTPRQIVESADPRLPPEPGTHVTEPVFHSRDIQPAGSGWKPTHLLSNGRYSVALRAGGAGVSRWQGRHVSRWRDDLLRDSYGTFFYLRQQGLATVTSLTALPAPGAGWHYRTRFMADRVQFDAQGDNLLARTTVLVSPEDDTELRTVTLQNTGRTELVLELTSCFEPVLTDPRADEAHPAFSNLFMATRWEPEWRALMLTRKPRLHGDPQMAVSHFLAEADADVVSVNCITDRRAFSGRNRWPHQPALQVQPPGDDGTPVNGLDPVACLCVTLRLAPGAVARLTFATTAADTADELAARIDKYLQPMHVERATRMAATLAQVRLRDLALTPTESLALQDLTTALMYSTPRATPERALLDKRQLWRFGVSGDKPIVLLYIHSASGMPLVNALLRAQPWWTFGGQSVDVVVLNSEPHAYLMPLQRDILALRDRLLHTVQNSFVRGGTADFSAGFYLLREQDLAVMERAALAGLARIVLTADGRPLEQQVATIRESWQAQRSTLPPRVTVGGEGISPAAQPSANPAHPPPEGRFDATSGEFQFELAAGQTTPRPWVNVIANPGFGFQVSETGAGYTWAGNSRLHQLTPWSNDPVRDPAHEHWLLQDRDTGEVFALTPSQRHDATSVWQVRHGQGYSVFEGQHAGLHVQTTLFADLNDAVKVVQVRIRQTGGARRRLRAISMVEWQLGDARAARRTLTTWKGTAPQAVFAQQRESLAGFGGATAFLMLTGAATTSQWTCDRREFFDTRGQMVLPDVLGQRCGGTADPCAALSADLELARDGTLQFNMILGHAADAPAAEQLAQQWAYADTGRALARVRGWWAELLGRVQVRTPDPLFDALVNRWLLYQTLTSRLWSKAGFYQAGGAFGFRDQLQDAMAFAVTDPERLREQLLLNASRQFPEGDVQHWWHAPGGEGVRTHFSDDLLWLPFACAHYIEVTGDDCILDAQIAFIEGPAIAEGAEDAYYAPQVSPASASLLEHCARTLDRSLAVGTHGLPLMGTGDWNDGMNRVGHEGRGESVWLAWFLCSVVSRFAPLAEARGEIERAARWRRSRDGWIAALHDAGWDGQWFRRAFFDNGEALGSTANDECRIDLIAQAWAVLSEASSEGYTRTAMQSMRRELVNEDAGLVRLLSPPFAHSHNNPGYIQAYPPGVRENGGQYAHAGVWALMAQAMTGDVEGAWQSFEFLSPAHRHAHPVHGPRYELEPYVMAGDIYSATPYLGRGGWSWYTGSAAWLHRAAMESLLGLTVRPGAICVSPCLPAHWPAVEIQLAVQDHQVHIRWERPASVVAEAFAPDQVAIEGQWIALGGLPKTASVLVRGAPGSAVTSPETRQSA